MKSILCLFEGDDEEMTALATAVHLAESVGGDLEVLHVTYMSEVGNSRGAMLAGSGFLDVIDSHRERIREQARTLYETVIAQRRPAGGTAASRFTVLANARNADLVRTLTFADLVVAGAARGTSDVVDRTPVDLALFAARRPVLVVRPEPGDAAAKIVGARTAIAWDGSLAATRALVTAAPLLAGQQSVTLLTAAPAVAAPDAALHFLAAHGIDASHETVEGDAPVAAIIDRVRERGIGLLVTGAYGHSLIREKIFGGFTDRLLTEADVPLLLVN